MQTHEYAIHLVDGLWQVRVNSRLVSGQPTQMEALGVAWALAEAGALRGERSKVLMGDLGGETIDVTDAGPAKPRSSRGGGAEQ